MHGSQIRLVDEYKINLETRSFFLTIDHLYIYRGENLHNRFSMEMHIYVCVCMYYTYTHAHTRTQTYA